MDDSELLDLLQTLSDWSASPLWYIRHGAMLMFASMAVHSASKIGQSSMFPSLINHLRDALKDDKVLR